MRSSSFMNAIFLQLKLPFTVIRWLGLRCIRNFLFAPLTSIALQHHLKVYILKNKVYNHSKSVQFPFFRGRLVPLVEVGNYWNIKPDFIYCSNIYILEGLRFYLKIKWALLKFNIFFHDSEWRISQISKIIRRYFTHR